MISHVFTLVHSGGGMLVLSLLLGNFFNFLFNAILGRALTFEQFGVVTLINTFWYLTSVILSSLGSTVNHRVAYLCAKVGIHAGTAFFQTVFKKSILISFVLFAIWILITPFLSTFFKVDNSFIFIFFAPVFTLGIATAVNRGFLQGNLQFGHVALIAICESVSKLVIAVALIFLNLKDFASLSIPLSIFVSFFVALLVILRTTPQITPNHSSSYRFPKRFFTGSIFTHLSSMLFLTLDVVLAKHFLSPHAAGQYAMLSLVGKMVYFLGSLPNQFTISYVAREKGRNKNPDFVFYRLFSASSFLVINAFVALGFFGSFFVPLLLGQKAILIIPYLSVYTLSFGLLSLSNSIVVYHLAREHYFFPILSIIYAISMAFGITLFHAHISQITQVILAISLLNFVSMFFLHILERNGRYIIRNLIDFVDLLFPAAADTQRSSFSKNILIFNWRDTRHSFAGGAEVYIHELAKRWVAKGHNVVLFCGNDGMLPRNEKIDGVNIVRRGGFYFVYVWAFLYYLVQFRGKFDVIVDCENGIPFFTPLYAKEKKFLIIHHVHQEVFRKSLTFPFSIIASFLELKLMPYVYKNVRVITVSPSSAKAIMDHKLSMVAPIIAYNGVDINVYKPGAKTKNPLILYLGRLKYYKSLNIFIRAARKVLEQEPAAEFIIAGEGEEKENLAKFARKIGILDKIQFLGKVTEQQKVELYQKAWVFVNPSYMEGWGITTIEANACGTPVIASNVPGLRDSVKNPHGGFLVPYGNTNMFASKILLLIQDKKLRNKMSYEAILWAKKFDWEKTAKKSLKLLTQ